MSVENKYFSIQKQATRKSVGNEYHDEEMMWQSLTSEAESKYNLLKAFSFFFSSSSKA